MVESTKVLRRSLQKFELETLLMLTHYDLSTTAVAITSNILHGSANPIGGQNQVIKLRWGATGEEMKSVQATLESSLL